MRKRIYYTCLFEERMGTVPYYIGKGKGHRAFHNNERHQVPQTQIELSAFLFRAWTKTVLENEADALQARAIYMIAVFGRKDLGTGHSYLISYMTAAKEASGRYKPM